MLAVKIVQEQGIEVQGVAFETPFLVPAGHWKHVRQSVSPCPWWILRRNTSLCLRRRGMDMAEI